MGRFPNLRDALTNIPETSYDPRYHAEKKAEWYNNTPGELTGWRCEKCRNRGSLMVVTPEGRTAVKECDCMTIRKSLKRLQQSGLENLVRSCRFESFQTPEPWQEAAKRAAIDYARSPSGRWFLAAGNAGSGKTHLCVAICRELMLRGLDTRYMLWRDDGTKIKAALKEREAYQSAVAPLKVVPVLYIDDFLKCGKNEQPTTADVNLAFEILNARYINPDLVTIISTERTLPELLEIDQGVGSRIYERCKRSNIAMHGIEKNWRLR